VGLDNEARRHLLSEQCTIKIAYPCFAFYSFQQRNNVTVILVLLSGILVMVRVDGHANAFRITVIFVLLLLSVILVMVRVDGHANPFRIQRRQPRFYATTTFLSPSADSEQQPSQSYCNVWSNAAIGLCPTQERNTRRPPREANVFFLTLETRGSSSFSFVPHFSTTDVGLFNRKHSNTSCGNFNHTNNFINSKHSVD
jgi:hypothetical protein